MSQIRSFLAIDLDDDLKPKINKIIREFKKIDANIKYVDLNNLHFTLKFFGDIDTDGIDLISQKIEKTIKEFKPFDIKITGCGAFPNNNHIKVIWIGVESDELLGHLHDKLDGEFSSIGFDKDKKFSTHLTIGRMKSAKNKNQIKSVIEEFENVEIGNMNVSSIALKKSTLKPSGPIYENLKTYDL